MEQHSTEECITKIQQPSPAVLADTEWLLNRMARVPGTGGSPDGDTDATLPSPADLVKRTFKAWEEKHPDAEY